ncbi:hypothetical protein ScPMuIL_018600 [Solemya velum]
MAEAAVETRSVNSSRFYCHQCSAEIHPTLPEFRCPQCDNGFVEEIEDPPTPPETDPAAQFAELWGRAFLESFRNPSSSDTPLQFPNLGDREESSLGPITRSQNIQGGPRQRFTIRRLGTGQPVPSWLGTVPVSGNVFQIHSQPGDYAWGIGGLDSIITQLLNQLDGSGPQPAEKEKIEALPTVKITQEQVDKRLQCSVCMEDFNVDEDVRQLPCDHHYHNDCIVPWLKLHGTCPVCRKDLNGVDSTLGETDNSEPSPTNDNTVMDDSSADGTNVFDLCDDRREIERRSNPEGAERDRTMKDQDAKSATKADDALIDKRREGVGENLSKCNSEKSHQTGKYLKRVVSDDQGVNHFPACGILLQIVVGVMIKPPPYLNSSSGYMKTHLQASRWSKSCDDDEEKYALFHPIHFFRYLFNPVLRIKQPPCLTDPSLGRHDYLQLQDVRLHYVISGENGKPLMLFLHGFPEFWYSWRYQIPEFQKEYRVVAMDMRGYGDSEKPSGVSNYRVDKLISDVKQLITALGYSKCVLVGHDWGGNVAWHFADVYPEMLNKLIIMNIGHPKAMAAHLRSHFSQFMKSWYIAFFQVPWIPELFLTYGDYTLLEAAFTGPKSDLSNKFSPETMEAYKYSYSQKGAFQSMINYYRAALRYPPPRSSEKPKPIKTLIIWGDPDVALEKEMAYLSSKFVSDLKIEVVENSSHFVQVDTPTAVKKLMRKFLSPKKIE